jgi:hypothetical protein
MTKPRLTLLTLVLGALAAHAPGADEPKGIYIPNAENLDQEGKELLAQGNSILTASFHALADRHDPAEAERLMAQVIAIRENLLARLGESAPGGMKVGLYTRAHKNRDIVEHSGGLDGFAEMDMVSLAATFQQDFHVHRRRILANFASQAKDVRAAQKSVVTEVQEQGNARSRVGSSASAKPDDPAKQGQAGKPPPPAPEDDAGPTRMAVGAQADAAAQAKAQDQSQSSENALVGAKPDATKAKPQGRQPDQSAKAPDKPTSAGSAQQQSSSGAPRSSAGQSGSGQPSSPSDLAQRQEDIANRLDAMARDAGATAADANGKAVAERFAKAAKLARSAAEALRKGDHEAAAAAVAAADRALDEAIATSQGDSEAAERAATAALEGEVARIQERQADLVKDAHTLAQGVAAGTVGADDAKAESGRLARREAELKTAIDEALHGIDGLAGTDADGEQRGQAVREDLKAAAEALRNGRASHEAVNATVHLEQGRLGDALTTIARASTALDQAHARLASAADAAAGGHGSDQQALEQLQRLSSAMRRLGETVQAARDGARAEATANGAPAAGAGQPPSALPTELGQALEASAQALSTQLDQTLGKLPQVSDADRARIAEALRQRPSFASDAAAGQERLSAVVAAVEGVEAELARRVSEDRSHAALRTFLRDPVPAGYRAGVAAYYQMIAGGADAAAAGKAP